MSLEPLLAVRTVPQVMESHSVPYLMSADLRNSGLLWPPAGQPGSAAGAAK